MKTFLHKEDRRSKERRKQGRGSRREGRMKE